MKRTLFLIILWTVFATFLISIEVIAQNQNENNKTISQDAKVVLLERLQKKAESKGFIDICESVVEKTDKQVAW
jgi:hypothetical protein